MNRHLTDGHRLVLVAGAAALLALLPSVGWDLFWDDYVALRPRSIADILAAWHGPWDVAPGGLPPYYRPLALTWFAGLFHVFGVNAPPMHAVSIALLACSAWLVGRVAWQVTGSASTGRIAAGLYAIHPVTTSSGGVWVINQVHQWASILALLAALIWLRGLRPGGRWTWGHWLAMTGSVAGAVLFKEDSLFVLPALLVAQAVWSRMATDRPPPAVGTLIASGLFVVLVVAWRIVVLGGVHAPQAVTWTGGIANLFRGPLRAGLVLAFDSPMAYAASGVMSVLAAIALWAVWRGDRGHRLLVALGVIWFTVTNVPLIFMSFISRYHLLAIGAAWALAAGVGVVTARLRATGRHALAGTGMLVVSAILLGGSWHVQQDHMPCTAGNLWADADIADFAWLPTETSRWLSDKPAACRAGRYRPLVHASRALVWTHHTDEGNAARIVMLIPRATPSATLRVRHASATLTRPVQVAVSGAGGHHRVVLSDDTWTRVEVPLSEVPLVLTRRMHRLDLFVSRMDSPLPGLEVEVEVDGIAVASPPDRPATDGM